MFISLLFSLSWQYKILHSYCQQLPCLEPIFMQLLTPTLPPLKRLLTSVVTLPQASSSHLTTLYLSVFPATFASFSVPSSSNCLFNVHINIASSSTPSSSSSITAHFITPNNSRVAPSSAPSSSSTTRFITPNNSSTAPSSTPSSSSMLVVLKYQI